MGDRVPWGAGIRDDQDEDPFGSSERETDHRGARDRFVDRYRASVEDYVREHITITYHGHEGNELTLGQSGVGRPCDYVHIAVYEHTDNITLLEVNNTRVGKLVPWRTFITFMRYLYTRDCGAELMCETALIDMLQGVIVKYARDGIRLKVQGFTDHRGVKVIKLCGEDGGLPFVNVIDAYRVKTKTSAEENPGWRWLCTTHEEAMLRGFIVHAGGDECVGEPRGVGDDGAEKNDHGASPRGHVDALMRLNSRLLRFLK
jgi:hypothetical protein